MNHPLILPSAVALALVFGSPAFASEAGDSPYAPLDLLIREKVEAIRDAAEAGDVTAMYAMWLTTWHGLKGQPRDLTGSARWRAAASRWGEQTTHVVTRFIPGETRPQVREVPIGVTLRAFDAAVRPCMDHLLGSRPDEAACGSDPDDRRRRQDAWAAMPDGR